MKPYDNAVHLLVAAGALSLCRWLGEPTDDAHLISTTLPATTLDPDTLLALGDRRALHIEFQTVGQPDFGLRMLEYTARLRRQPELAGWSLRHQVVVLGDGWVDDHVLDEGLSFYFHVRYLREEDPVRLLADPMLAPLAVLGNAERDERPRLLRAALERVRADGRPELVQAAQDFARIRLPSSTIEEVRKEVPVPVPTMWQYRYEEGREEGQIEAIAEALRERFGDDPRVTEIAGRLHGGGRGWFSRVLAAESLDDLA